MTLDELVSGLGALLGLNELEFDDQGGLGLYLPNGLEIGLRRSEDGSELLAFAVLRVIDDLDAEAPALLRSSLLGERSGGACLSVGEDAEGRDCLVLWRSFAVALIDVQAFADALGRFAEAALIWRDGDSAVADALTESENPPAIPALGMAFALRA
jgi:hypothetical protein